MVEARRPMNLYELLIAVLLVATTGCAPTPSPETPLFDADSRIILEQDGPTEFIYWVLPNDERLWGADLGEVPSLMTFRDSLRLVLGEQRFLGTVEKESTQGMDTSIIAMETNGDRINALLVHTGTLGSIRPMHFLEAQLLNYQISKYPFLGHPTEFHAFIVKNPAEDTLKVYFGASDQPWPPKPGPLIKEMEKDLANDWRLIYHMHDHFEGEANNHLGILAPSLADAQYYQWLAEDFGLENALITNGMHTVVIERSEFDTFESH